MSCPTIRRGGPRQVESNHRPTASTSPRRHRALQGLLPRAHRRSGLPEACRPGPLPRGARAHQEGEPAAAVLRRHLQPQSARSLLPAATSMPPWPSMRSRSSSLPRSSTAPSALCRAVPSDYSDKRIAIIGAVPAGLSCAYFLATYNYSVTVFDKNEQPGGMLRYGIPNFRLEKPVLDAEIDVLKELGVIFRCGVEVGKDVTLKQLREQGYDCVLFLASAPSQSAEARRQGRGSQGRVGRHRLPARGQRRASRARPRQEGLRRRRRQRRDGRPGRPPVSA